MPSDVRRCSHYGKNDGDGTVMFRCSHFMFCNVAVTVSLPSVDVDVDNYH